VRNYEVSLAGACHFGHVQSYIRPLELTLPYSSSSPTDPSPISTTSLTPTSTGPCEAEQATSGS
jgi:hypothetical protein